MNAYIYDGVRTGRGAVKPGGALTKTKPIELGQTLLDALKTRHTDKLQISDLILGCVTQTGEQGGNIARALALSSNLPSDVAALTVNNFCCSGLDACQIAALKAPTLDKLLLAGGVESMSRVAPFSDAGPYYSDPATMQACSFSPLWSAADFVATKTGITRDEADTYAEESQKRAGIAETENRFERSIISISTDDGHFARDETARPNTTTEKLASFDSLVDIMNSSTADKTFLHTYPEYDEVNHIHHVGSAPALADAASLILLGSADAGEAAGLKPRAQIKAVSNLSGDPLLSLTGGIEAAKDCLKKADMSANDIDLFEFNEAYAAVCLLFMQELGISRDKLNVNGGAIALGHPMGATGGILLCTLLDELERQDKTMGMVAISGAAGLGSAMIIERI
ncbi:acetyl-CoA C-acyltransferase [Kordiimonas laminariae]|uniref:acetyl-CoA C-acyltransferase n=1 Tax=Kordiimonas laminariae TaxID=2917717 RepID=UPI001FF4644A|nr:acetyl-CoA C-acyltransferase [Kordiimonas laminariae]